MGHQIGKAGLVTHHPGKTQAISTKSCASVLYLNRVCQKHTRGLGLDFHAPSDPGAVCPAAKARTCGRNASPPVSAFYGRLASEGKVRGAIPERARISLLYLICALTKGMHGQPHDRSLPPSLCSIANCSSSTD